MLALTGGMRIFLYRGPTDMRNGFDGLSGLVERHYHHKVAAGCLFVFVNRRRTHVKLLYWDEGGLALWYKRLESGTYTIPEAVGPTVELSSAGLAMLLEGITPLRISRRYRRRGAGSAG